MQITVISDTHNTHEQLGILHGDVLIHCGDLFNQFSADEEEIEKIDDWFERQEFELILCIGGNHDFRLQKLFEQTSSPFRHAKYLQDSACSFRGIRFYGSPWVPNLPGQAYDLSSQELQEKWRQIPDDTDVLITHTPPMGILDLPSRTNISCGCSHLAARVFEVAPILHCFGHAHASSGQTTSNGISFMNASMVNSQYELTRTPYYFSI
jgi:Icc-related predicted phosphoesterase